jgi:hypothetical protein
MITPNAVPKRRPVPIFDSTAKLVATKCKLRDNFRELRTWVYRKMQKTTGGCQHRRKRLLAAQTLLVEPTLWESQIGVKHKGRMKQVHEVGMALLQHAWKARKSHG